MQVSIVDFYKEVTGKTCVVTTRTARNAMDRWVIPYETSTATESTRKYWKADLKHIPNAKASYTKEVAEAAAKVAAAEAKKPTVKTNGQGMLDLHAPDREGFTAMQRIANLEQELRTLREIVQAFVSKF